MKIIVSSKYFYSVLKRIDSSIDSVYPISDGIAICCTNDKKYAVNCERSDSVPYIDQSDVRYDFLRIHLSKVPDQPIVVNFSKQKVEITHTF